MIIIFIYRIITYLVIDWRFTTPRFFSNWIQINFFNFNGGLVDRRLVAKAAGGLETSAISEFLKITKKTFLSS